MSFPRQAGICCSCKLSCTLWNKKVYVLCEISTEKNSCLNGRGGSIFLNRVMKKLIYILILSFFIKCTPPDVYNPGAVGSEENLISVLLACLISPCDTLSPVSASPLPAGELDLSFNGTGYVTLDIAGFEDRAWGVAVDNGDNIIATGDASLATTDLVVWKVNSDGSSDTNFNTVGYSLGDYGGVDQGFDIVYSPDNTFYAAGSVTNATEDTAIWKYGQNGLLDTTLNETGIVMHDNATMAATAGIDNGYAIALDSSGRIVVGGMSQHDVNQSNAAIWRYNPDGTLDATFNGVGYLAVDGVAGATGSLDEINGLIIDSSGKIVVVGISEDFSGSPLQFVMRLNADGTPDTGFNSGGPLLFSTVRPGDFFNSLRARIVENEDGSYFVSIAEIDAANYVLTSVKKITSAGILDTTFQNLGVLVLNNVNSVYTIDMNIDSAGNLLLAGGISEDDPALADFKMMVMRLLPDGSLDATFGSGCPGYPSGCFYQNIGIGVDTVDIATSIAFDSQNRIILGGMSLPGATSLDMTVWRLK